MVALNSLAKWLLAFSVLAFGFILYAGHTGRFNDPSIYYAGTDARTGQPAVVQGCRPERLNQDGSCDQSFRWREFGDEFFRWD